jgi:hypothetical protein
MSGIVRLERGNYAANEQGWQFISDAPQSLRREVEARDRAGGRILHSLGFAYARIDYGGGWIRHAFYAPHWSVVLILAAAPAAWVFARLRNSNRAKTGQCRVCGYDLRATPDRCPECGASD